MKLKQKYVDDVKSVVDNIIPYTLIEVLANHFNYSIKDINSYNELTNEEKSIISEEEFNLICE
jgi:hypothetical protein